MRAVKRHKANPSEGGLVEDSEFLECTQAKKRLEFTDAVVLGQTKNSSVQKSKDSLLSVPDVESNQPHSPNAAPSAGTPIANVLKLDFSSAPRPSAKMKLQLFPLNGRTRAGLEKDGHNPHLELTLNARKKMASVLKHLNSKWGNSSIASGEIMLFPYNVGLRISASCTRWTLKDIDTTVREVYDALACPANFRLRYGWLCNVEPDAHFPSTLHEGFCQDEGIKTGGAANTETNHDEMIQLGIFNEEFRKGDGIHSTKALAVGQINADPRGDGVSLDNGLSLTSAIWSDTCLSIGGLLSEVSLQGKLKQSEPKSNQTDSDMHPAQLTSDSLDAFVATRIKPQNYPQCQKPSSHAPHSSILDGEETCHAFAFQNRTSSSKNVLALPGSTSEDGSGNQEGKPKPSILPIMTETNKQTGTALDNSCQDSKPGMLSCSRTYNDESSLGLTGIRWNDSLGPFDLGLNSFRPINNVDSITSLSKFLS